MPRDAVCGLLCEAEKEARKANKNWKPHRSGQYHLCRPGPDKLPSRPFRVVLQTDSEFVHTAVMEGYKNFDRQKLWEAMHPGHKFPEEKDLRRRNRKVHPDDKYINAVFASAEELLVFREVETVVELKPRGVGVEAARHLARTAVKLDCDHDLEADLVSPFERGKRPDRDVENFWPEQVKEYPHWARYGLLD